MQAKLALARAPVVFYCNLFTRMLAVFIVDSPGEFFQPLVLLSHWYCTTAANESNLIQSPPVYRVLTYLFSPSQDEEEGEDFNPDEEDEEEEEEEEDEEETGEPDRRGEKRKREDDEDDDDDD